MIGGGDIALFQKTEAEMPTFFGQLNLILPCSTHSARTPTSSSRSVLGTSVRGLPTSPLWASLNAITPPCWSSTRSGENIKANISRLTTRRIAGADTYYYQCADISLVSNTKFTTDEQYVCGNYISELEIVSSEESLHLGNTTASENSSGSSGYTGTASTSSGSTNPHFSSSSSRSKISAADGGGIGASVTVFVVLVLAGLL